MRCARRLSSVVFRVTRIPHIHTLTRIRQSAGIVEVKNDKFSPILFPGPAVDQSARWSAEINFLATWPNGGPNFGQISETYGRASSLFPVLVHVQPISTHSELAPSCLSQFSRQKLPRLSLIQSAPWQHLPYLHAVPAVATHPNRLKIISPPYDTRVPESLSAAGPSLQARPVSDWTRNEVFNWPNAVSMARLLSGPPIALLVVQGHFSTAFIAISAAGASDWFDGYLARRLGTNSVLGSYLDPLADKVLIGCVVMAMLHAALLPWWLVALMLGRDSGLLLGAVMHRARALQWKWKSGAEFFATGIGGAALMQPLWISKVNTGMQLALLGAALGLPACGCEDSMHIMPLLIFGSAGTTCASAAAYLYTFLTARGGTLPQPYMKVRRSLTSTRIA